MNASSSLSSSSAVLAFFGPLGAAAARAVLGPLPGLLRTGPAKARLLSMVNKTDQVLDERLLTGPKEP